ncbi:peptidoglycan/LPS O-acetylase OafA/YrhL [Sphaerotilus hippei]|uniref:Peptidoglycan/LPS O-acetylase OafA/YrhL n=2 Tax=Sphaerotilus hippei TaxID=744406 RepID=A0A318H699_9BURK|nr:peptidoglycan/LPS O-acetylase OafA/YrhL [Sphaerotilus hippei]
MNERMASPPRSKQRYDFLDGIRGLAAIAVVVFHFSQLNGHHWIGAAWISVDLFFILSGLVICHSYDGKIRQGMGIGHFFIQRLIRLGPLYLCGLVLGMLAAVLYVNTRPGTINPVEMMNAAMLGMLLLPYFNSSFWPFGDTGISGEIFPLNGPAWSLFFELFVNVVFFLCMAHWKRLNLVAFTAATLALFIGCTLAIMEVNPGWGQANFIYGFPRVTAGFFMGVLICRHGRRLGTPPRGLALGLVGLMFLSFMTKSGAIALAVSLVVAPLAIWAASTLAIEQGPMRAACTRLGELSYPLYVVHFPVYRLMYEIPGVAGLGPVAQTAVTALGSVAVAAALIPLDRALRRRLTAWHDHLRTDPSGAATPSFG